MQILISLQCLQKMKVKPFELHKALKKFLDGTWLPVRSQVYAALVFCSLQSNFKRKEIAFRFGTHSLLYTI